MQELDHTAYQKLRSLFAPDSAAIIGASTNPGKMGGRALKFCLTRGYQGRLYPINANNDEVQGVRAYRSIADLPEAPDIAVIAVPAPQVRDSLIAAGEKGAKAAVVYGAQFAEAGGEGLARQQALLDIACQYNMRMVGPNCMGIISLASGFVASFTTAPEHHDGNGWPAVGSVSVASQSGAVGIQMFAQLRDRGLGLANWISTGNQADVDVADCIAYFAGDPETKTIAVYLEDASRGLKLAQALELARQARKPVVALKVGTTPDGGVAAAGHTASMYVEDRLVDDLFRQYGVLRARSVNELIDLVAACNAGVVPTSGEVAAISVSGGGAVMIADAAAKGDLTLPAYAADDLKQLKAVNSFVNDRNPIDISAPSMRDMEITGGHLQWGTERGQPIMLGYISHIPLVPRTREKIMPILLKLTDDHPEQLIALTATLLPEDRAALIATGMAVFDDPTVATEAISKLAATGRAFADDPQWPAPATEIQDLKTGLAKAGIERVAQVAIDNVEMALAALADQERIVLKLVAKNLHHKTEIGGVITDLTTADAVLEAHARLSRIAESQRETYPDIAVVAEPQIAGVEVLLGLRRDPYFGPIICLATGGTFTELFDDMTYLKPPVSAAQIDAALSRIKAAKMLDGWRGTPAVNRTALIRTLAALSEQASALPPFEINPLMVTQSGPVAVDLVAAD